MRYELKYKIEHFGLSSLLQAIRLHPAGFRKIYPDRQINNIYFDSPSLTTFEDNVSGVSERKKFRIRWYGVKPEIIESPKLEIKIKSNKLGAKEVYPANDFTLDNLMPITHNVNQLVKKNGSLRPVLMNSYNRSYFGTTNGDFRITVDRDMRYFSLLAGRQFTRYTIHDDDLIMELKYDESLDGKTDRITQALPFRQTKSSKYVTGVYLVSS